MKLHKKFNRQEFNLILAMITLIGIVSCSSYLFGFKESLEVKIWLVYGALLVSFFYFIGRLVIFWSLPKEIIFVNRTIQMKGETWKYEELLEVSVEANEGFLKIVAISKNLKSFRTEFDYVLEDSNELSKLKKIEKNIYILDLSESSSQ